MSIIQFVLRMTCLTEGQSLLRVLLNDIPSRMVYYFEFVKDCPIVDPCIGKCKNGGTCNLSSNRCLCPAPLTTGSSRTHDCSFAMTVGLPKGEACMLEAVPLHFLGPSLDPRDHIALFSPEQSENYAGPFTDNLVLTGPFNLTALSLPDRRKMMYSLLADQSVPLPPKNIEHHPVSSIPFGSVPTSQVRTLYFPLLENRPGTHTLVYFSGTGPFVRGMVTFKQLPQVSPLCVQRHHYTLPLRCDFGTPLSDGTCSCPPGRFGVSCERGCGNLIQTTSFGYRIRSR